MAGTIDDNIIYEAVVCEITEKSGKTTISTYERFEPPIYKRIAESLPRWLF